MTKTMFIRALWPVWMLEATFISLRYALLQGNALDENLLILFVSLVVLPLLAGYRVMHYAGNTGLAALGGTSISVISMAAAGAIQLLTSAGLAPFVDYVAMTLLFSLLPQAAFGGAGALCGRYLTRNPA